ncbi:MAG TPA: YciI family protein [Polyangia bacterium]|nr:YciI family protein [Polyangia bacterium]
MRFISLFTQEKKNNVPPTQAEMEAMGKLIEDGMKAGWLIATEGVQFGGTGVKVHKAAGGDITVTDGPFTEAKEVIGGYALMRANSKAEVVQLCRNFLQVVGQGTCEVHELFEQPASGGR